MSSKLKSPNQGNESNTMDSFQDGGQQNMNSDRSQNDSYPPNLDGPHMNSEINNYSQGAPDQPINSDSFNKMNDSMASSQMPGYGAYNRGNYMSMAEQHGGVGNTGNGDYVHQNNQFNQFNPQTMRPSYPQPTRQPPMSSRMGMNPTGMGMVPQNYPSPQQRFPLSGQSIQQQGGPTPTLNQLLQNAGGGSGQPRYQGSGYGPEFNMNQQKGMEDVPGNPGFNSNPSQSWGGPQHRGMNPYQQPQSYRNQVDIYLSLISVLVTLNVIFPIIICLCTLISTHIQICKGLFVNIEMCCMLKSVCKCVILIADHSYEMCTCSYDWYPSLFEYKR